MRDIPACHVFSVGSQEYAYDLHTQNLLALEPELASLLRNELRNELRGQDGASQAARDALNRARKDDGLFLNARPTLVPWRQEPDANALQGIQHLVLTVTEACNLRCTYCMHGSDLNWVRDHGPAQMSVATALQAVEYYLTRQNPARTPVISFYGGEALLNFSVIKAVVAAVAEHPRGADTVFAIDTNGVLLAEEMIAFILQEKLFLQISIDGPAEIHDRHRVDVGGGPSFDRILANIDTMLSLDPTVADRLSLVMTLAPPVDLFASAELFNPFPPYVKHGITKQPNLTVNFANLNGQGWAKGQEQTAGLPPINEQMKQARAMYLEALAEGRRFEIGPVIRALFEPELIKFYNRSRAPLGDTFVPGGNCRPGQRKLHVAVDGCIHPCERTGVSMPLGDLASGVELSRVRALHRNFHEAVSERCGQCWALRLCRLCFAVQAEHVDLAKDAFPVPEAICEQVRARAEMTMKMMVRVLEMPIESRQWLDKSEISR